MTAEESILRDFGYNIGDALAVDVAHGADVERKDIPLDLIKPHPDNRRVHDDVVEQLVESIQKDGLGQLPLVRKIDDTTYQLIAGEHRWRAYRALFEKSGDDKYRVIPCIVKRNCDDDLAERLLWATNLHGANLSAAERGHAYDVLAYSVDKLREENPDKYRGVRTNAIVAQIASEQGHEVSERTVQRYRNQNREENLTAESAVVVKPKVDTLLDALNTSISKVELAVDNNELNPTLLRPYVKRLRALYLSRCSEE